MKVLINALRLAEGKSKSFGGNFYHVYNFLKSLINISTVQTFVIADEDSYDRLKGLISLDKLILYKPLLKGPLRIISEDYFIKSTIKKFNIDIYHRLIGQLPFITLPAYSVATIADLNFFTIEMGMLKKLYKRLSYYWTIKKADKIIAISEFTRGEILKHYNMCESNIPVVYHGTNLLQSNNKLNQELLVYNYWFTFGHQKHKNVETCINSVYQYNIETNSKDKIVIVGENEYLNNLRKSLDRNRRTITEFVGKVSEEKLLTLYTNARGFLFLSLYEGFGLPLLEAMQFGCPVIASNICSLPEVGSDAAEYVDPFDLATIVSVMKKISKDSEFRSKLINRGYLRAKQFSWDRSANDTVKIYKQLLNKEGK